MSNLPPGTFIVGNKLMSVCGYCRSLVTLNKFLFGSLHICVPEDERQRIKLLYYSANAQKNFKSTIGQAGKSIAG